PNYHEALLKLETDDFCEDTVVEELQKGYLLNGRVVRTSKVKVSKRTESREQRTEDAGPKTEKTEQKSEEEDKGKEEKGSLD
ncbi:MAG: nucleotide exchange factor GrpE, partial [Candidatus Omnitrophota bacterium]